MKWGDIRMENSCKVDLDSGPLLREGRLVVFQGVTPNIGTTVISFSSSIMLAEQTEAKVGYICLNLKSSKLHHYCGIREPQAVLDNIRAELKSRSLTSEDLYRLCERPKRTPRLNVLFGNLMREQAEFYSAEDIQFLLQLCRKTFDVTVVEVNAYWDNAATLIGIQEADERIIVSSDRLACLQEDFMRWHGRLAPVLNLQPEAAQLFVVKHQSLAFSGSAARLIRRFTGLQIIGSIRRYEAVENMLEEGRLIELAVEHAPMRNDLHPLVRSLSRSFHLSERSKLMKRSMLRKWLPVRSKADSAISVK